MTHTLRELNAAVEELWPTRFAEDWDRPGLTVGDVDDEVRHIHLAVDPVTDTVDEAIELGADALLVHHPLLLRGITSVATDRYKGALVTRLIRARCGLIAAHTNADIVADGTSGVLAARLGLVDLRPIVTGEREGTGIGRVGTLPEPSTLGRLALSLAEILPATATGIRVSGGYDDPVSRIALCGGAGDSLLGEAVVLDADVYITSDLRHHPASESREQAVMSAGPALIDVSHWASEWLWLESAATHLRELLPHATVTVSEIRTDPWDFVVTQ
ncbi:Nif3-like dinuclear metal center hexameric protein [Agreia sp. COWG]|uniref:Nif3-like dinuclear metal center hexameric protein n=1 Tax=Agreia sp. COWG TaxID=2773266 RepID=UPI0019274B78|nr:Nif3-like dinuclear metal center hexameric protein [Agreia sp. COWG]CAD5999046.1 GTP cyclohydrolase 1 type 2 homolog [Agreia sp. COWG]